MFKINLPDIEANNTPTWIELWYNRRYKMYVAQLMTEEGNQIGDAFYGTKEGAEIAEKEWERDYSIDHKYSLKKRKEYRQQLKE